MKIKEIAVWHIDLPVPSSYKLSGGRSYPTLDDTVVRITTECGIEGWGEACPFGLGYLPAHGLGVRAGIAELAPFLLGLDVRNIDRVNDAMDAVLPGLQYIKSAIDIACYDAFGKSVGLPVHTLLGGREIERMPIAGSITTGTSEEMVAVVDKFRQTGYRAFSIKVGGQDVEGDIARINAVLDARKPGEDYLVDVNRGWTLDTCFRVLAGVHHSDFTLEQPTASLREMRAIRQRTNIPISIDEMLDSTETLLSAITDEACDFVNLKTCKIGGLTKGRKLRDLCQTAGLAVSVQETGGTEIAFTALCHLATSTPKRIFRTVWDPRELAGISFATGGAWVEEGHAFVGDAPGLSLDVDLGKLGEPVAVYR